MPHRITIDGGPSFDVADDDTLMRGALRAGLGFPHDCGVGGCGSCRFELVEGEMQTLWEAAPGLSEREKRRGRRLACQSKPLSDARIKVRLAEDQQSVVTPKRFPVRLAARREIAPGMAEFTFRAEAPAAFRAGQYAIFHPPGAAGARAYSMSNLPNAEGEWRFVIRRTPGGVGSNAMFDALTLGDAVDLDAPYSHAWFRDDNERAVVCIGGGSGIGPVVSILAAALKAGKRAYLFEGARTQGDLCAPALLGDLLSRAAYIPVLSAEPEAGEWTGARGFVHTEVEAELAGQAEACEFYFAGPPPMVEAVQDLLVMRWKAPLAQIHFDRFF